LDLDDGCTEASGDTASLLNEQGRVHVPLSHVKVESASEEEDDIDQDDDDASERSASMDLTDPAQFGSEEDEILSRSRAWAEHELGRDTDPASRPLLLGYKAIAAAHMLGPHNRWVWVWIMTAPGRQGFRGPVTDESPCGPAGSRSRPSRC
jgi:hypothetical protein